jgi:2,4-diaminopentanoate dehydrogenase
LAICVILIGTGGVGGHALRGLIANPLYELVGVGVSSDAKAGKDAGELAALDLSTGIRASMHRQAAYLAKINLVKLGNAYSQ